MRTIDKIITKIDCKYGAPMGRASIGSGTLPITGGPRVFDCKVALIDGYDRGGAYWGWPNNLRVSYTKNLQYVVFYRAQ